MLETLSLMAAGTKVAWTGVQMCSLPALPCASHENGKSSSHVGCRMGLFHHLMKNETLFWEVPQKALVFLLFRGDCAEVAKMSICAPHTAGQAAGFSLPAYPNPCQRREASL